MPTGKLKMWNAERGYGFIGDDACGPDIFLHISALESAGIDPEDEEPQDVPLFLRSDKHPFVREKSLVSARAAKKLAAEFAFVFRDLRQPLKLVCQNCPTLRNGHERGGAAD
jgi:CspA family cold shock protein